MNFPEINVNGSLCLRCGACLRDCFPKLLAFGEDGLPGFIPGGAERCFRCQHCLSVCPSGALSWNGRNPAESSAIGPVPEPSEMMNLIRQRRSVRAYLRKNVSAEKLELLRRAMDFVPTGCNDHRLFFAFSDDLAVTDSFRERARQRVLARIAAGSLPPSVAHFANLKPALEAGADIFFRNAPHFASIAVPPDAKDAHIDPFIAAAQFELLASSLGLGTCWGGMVTDLFQTDEEFRAELRIPETHQLKIVMLFGEPAVHYARTPQPVPCQTVRLSKLL